MAEKKAQSAMEYLMTYGWAILIVAVVLGALFELGVFSSASLLGTSCVAASGFLCSNPVLSGSSLTLTLGQYTGINWNTATFCIVPSGFAPPNSMGCPSSYPKFSAGAFLNGQSGTYIFSSTPSYSFPPFGNVFSGTVWAVYTVQSYSGNLTDQIGTIIAKNVGTSSQSSSSALYVPITIDNSQSAATPSPFQQIIQFNPSSYAQYENSNLGNIRFYQGSTELHSWCESGCSSTASQATFWINLPSGIPANSVVTVNMAFEPTSTNYDGVYAGEAPQLSPTYGEYDNGASVFNFYDNFANGLGNNIINNGEQVTFDNNGINLTSGTGSSVVASDSMATLTINQNYYGQNYIFQSAMNFSLFDKDIYDGFGLYLLNTSSNTAWEQSNTILEQATLGSGVGQSMYNGVQNPKGTTNGYSGSVTWSMDETFIIGMIVVGGYVTDTFNYNTIIPAKGNYNPPTQYPAFGSWRFSSIHVYWVRILAYPPNGVMPSVSFGSVS